MSITIKDVAKKAGVSPSTVSFVMNKRKGISQKVIKKVEKTISELNYYPQRSARSLVTQKTSNIGFILGEKHFSIADPFYTKILLGAEFEARKHNYYVLLTSTDKKFDEKKSIPRFVIENNVDGIIIAGSTDDALINYIHQLGIPLVLIDYLPRQGEFHAVMIDNFRGAYDAVSHLIKIGHKNIGFISGSFDNSNIKERYFGYQQALEEYNLSMDQRFICTDEENSGIENGINAARKLIQNMPMPSAVFVANDAQAIGCLKVFKEEKIRVPEDIAVIGFDDIDFGWMSEPKLSSMHVFKEDMGALAVKKLINIIEKPDTKTDKTLVGVELIIRESCGGNKK